MVIVIENYVRTSELQWLGRTLKDRYPIARAFVAKERTNSRLKCDFGGEDVMVRGAAKVKLPLMFCLIALFADQLLKLTS